MAAGQKQRKQKTSKGENGAGGKLRQPLTEVQKVLLGGGGFACINRPDTKRAKRLASEGGLSKVKQEKAAKQKKAELAKQLKDLKAKTAA